MNAAIHYRISASRPETHIFEVELTIAKPEPDGQRLALPNWIPGSYMIRDFSRHLLRVQAFDSAGQSVGLHKTGKSDWQCAPIVGPLRVCYEVYAWDLSVRGAHLDQTHGFFNGTSVFLAVVGQEHLPHEVSIERPAGDTANWQVATSLPRLGAAPLGFGRYHAESYDALIDHPVEMGTFTHAVFTACGVEHEVAITGRHRADMDRLLHDLEKICTEQIRLFGEPAPFSRYVFLVTAVGNGYGGLEHRASTALLCSRDDLPAPGEPAVNPGDRYKSFLGLCSHEYFHSWNVKRIKPAAFIPYDLRAETPTTLLWAFEGITSYYDDLILARAGLISPQSYLELLAQQITRHLRTPGRFVQSVSDSSLDAWTKYYRQDENSPNAIVSYYVKGAMIALCLDLLIREKSAGRYSLDTLMQRLWRDFGQTGRGVEEGDIEAIAAQLCSDPLTGFWQNALRGTDELPLPELLTARGVQWTLRASESLADTGGKPASDSRVRASLGVKMQNADGGVQLQVVFSGGAAQLAGLSAGDVIIAVDGLRTNVAGLERLLATLRPGKRIELHAFRRDELLTVGVVLGEPVADTCVLQLPDDTQARQQVENWILGR
ncbi:MAG: PDZ domain-containing protein [Moraxellaceae bacterium]|nr:PDZ domain-containing protein [Moraxellaceae bacterium]